MPTPKTEKERRIRIISDGTSHGTKLVDAETGERIGLVRVVDIHLSADEPMAYARVEFIKPEIDMCVNMETVNDPPKGMVEAITPDTADQS